MTFSLPDECIANILEHIHHYDLSTLHCALLINRRWCTEVTSLLWRQPFNVLGRIDSDHAINLVPAQRRRLLCGYRYVKLVNSYLPFLSEKTRSAFGIRLNPTNRPPTFDYPKLLRELDLSDLQTAAYYWCEAHHPVSETKGGHNNTDPEKTEYRSLADELCKLFLDRCERFDFLCFNEKEPNKYQLSQLQELYPNLYRFTPSPKCVTRLNGLVIGPTLLEQLYSTGILKHSTNVECLRIEGFCKPADYLQSFIESQRKLRKLTIDGFWVTKLQTVLPALNSQHSLTYIEFYRCWLNDIALLGNYSICQNIETLRIISCRRNLNAQYFSFTSCHFPRLKRLDFIGIKYDYRTHTSWVGTWGSPPIEELSILLTRAAGTLQEVNLGLWITDIESVLPTLMKYCTNVTRFSATLTRAEDVLILLHSLRGFTQLTELSISSLNVLSTQDVLTVYSSYRAKNMISVPSHIRKLSIDTEWTSIREPLRWLLKHCEAKLDVISWICTLNDVKQSLKIIKDYSMRIGRIVQKPHVTGNPAFPDLVRIEVKLCEEDKKAGEEEMGMTRHFF
ncbi:10509_t:CDS:2 [Paraglomus occultum]|uniref:10509_t:CDS:1 n=1 Tax=Paraglomus occultum TaxID=144539 RepID=A0A9N8Z4S2_9GLOM|nr:10509_t:CDS:2 [Paraglomus occultum]